MIPPTTINVICDDMSVPGFTIETKAGTYWRPANVLIGRTFAGREVKDPTTGTLIDYKENSFFQNNNNVTMARYKVPAYRYKIVAWFDNRDGRRIA